MPSMQPCPACQHPVIEAAHFCPKCNHPFKSGGISSWSTGNKVLLITLLFFWSQVLGVVLLLLFLAWLFRR